MGPQGVVNTLKTAFGATKREWEAEKAAEAARRREESLSYMDRAPVQNGANTSETHAQQKGPAMAEAHDPNAAYRATQKNVKNAIMQVSKQPGAAIAQRQLHKQAAQDFAKAHGIHMQHFMELTPDAQKQVMSSNDPMALLQRYSNMPNYWVQQN